VKEKIRLGYEELWISFHKVFSQVPGGFTKIPEKFT
jgi:hypothetical protein